MHERACSRLIQGESDLKISQRYWALVFRGILKPDPVFLTADRKYVQAQSFVRVCQLRPPFWIVVDCI